MTDKRHRLVLVDDHPLFREGVALTLSLQSDLEIVGQGASASEAIRLYGDLKPDLLLLDLSMPGNGLNALATILDEDPEARIVILTSSEMEDDVFQALRSGARGYVLKGIGAQALIDIVRGDLNGESYVSPSLAARILTEMRGLAARPAREPAAGEPPAAATLEEDPLSALTRREEQILKLVADGNSNKEVAIRLDLTEKTVKHHMTSILHKLKVRNRTEAAMLLKDARPK